MALAAAATTHDRVYDDRLSTAGSTPLLPAMSPPLERPSAPSIPSTALSAWPSPQRPPPQQTPPPRTGSTAPAATASTWRGDGGYPARLSVSARQRLGATGAVLTCSSNAPDSSAFPPLVLSTLRCGSAGGRATNGRGAGYDPPSEVPGRPRGRWRASERDHHGPDVPGTSSAIALGWGFVERVPGPFFLAGPSAGPLSAAPSPTSPTPPGSIERLVAPSSTPGRPDSPPALRRVGRGPAAGRALNGTSPRRALRGGTAEGDLRQPPAMQTPFFSPEVIGALTGLPATSHRVASHQGQTRAPVRGCAVSGLSKSSSTAEDSPPPHPLRPNPSTPPDLRHSWS